MAKRSDWEYALRSGAPLPEDKGGLRQAPRRSSRSGSTEVVVKAVSHIKTVRGTKIAVEYIASHGGKSDLDAYDESGNHLEGDELKEAIEREWGLTPDHDNLSPKARELKGTDAFKELPDAEKYNHRQSSHYMLSLPVDHGEVSDRQMHQIAQDFLAPMREAGHKAIYAIHDHQANPHIHFVISYKDAARENSTLRVNPKQIDALREHAKDVSRRNGLDVTASRRESREDLVHKMMKGFESLRTPTSRWAYENDNIDKRTKTSLLERQVPNWYERRGTEFEQRRTGAKIPGFAVRKAELPELSEKKHQALDKWASQYKDPQEAKVSFLEMAAENERLAYWNSANRPQVFGHIPELDRIRPTKGEGYEAITMHELKLSETWKRQGRGAIEKAQLDTPEHIQTANRQLREVNKKLQTYGQAVKEHLIEHFIITRVAKRVGIDVDRITFERIQQGIGKYPVIHKPEKSQPAEKPKISLTDISDTVKDLWKRVTESDRTVTNVSAKEIEQHNKADTIPFKHKGGSETDRAKEIYDNMHRKSDNQVETIVDTESITRTRERPKNE